MKECTTIEYPFSLYNAEQDKTEIGYATLSAGYNGYNGIAMHASTGRLFRVFRQVFYVGLNRLSCFSWVCFLIQRCVFMPQ